MRKELTPIPLSLAKDPSGRRTGRGSQRGLVWEKTMKAQIKQTVRELRKNQTESERILWEVLRNRGLDGKKFLRQHPIHYEINGKRKLFIADFYCSEKKLVIEVDGSIPIRYEEYEKACKEIIKIKGLHILRFKEEEIKENPGLVIKKIRKYLK